MTGVADAEGTTDGAADGNGEDASVARDGTQADRPMISTADRDVLESRAS